MENEMDDKQLDQVSAGRLYAGSVSPDNDTGYRDALMRRQVVIEDEEWNRKVWEAYRANGRKWTAQVIDVIATAVEVGAAVYTGGSSLAVTRPIRNAVKSVAGSGSDE